MPRHNARPERDARVMPFEFAEHDQPSRRCHPGFLFSLSRVRVGLTSRLRHDVEALETFREGSMPITNTNTSAPGRAYIDVRVGKCVSHQGLLDVSTLTSNDDTSG